MLFILTGIMILTLIIAIIVFNFDKLNFLGFMTLGMVILFSALIIVYPFTKFDDTKEKYMLYTNNVNGVTLTDSSLVEVSMSKEYKWNWALGYLVSKDTVYVVKEEVNFIKE